MIRYQPVNDWITPDGRRGSGELCPRGRVGHFGPDGSGASCSLSITRAKLTVFHRRIVAHQALTSGWRSPMSPSRASSHSLCKDGLPEPRRPVCLRAGHRERGVDHESYDTGEPLQGHERRLHAQSATFGFCRCCSPPALIEERGLELRTALACDAGATDYVDQRRRRWLTCAANSLNRGWYKDQGPESLVHKMQAPQRPGGMDGPSRAPRL